MDERLLREGDIIELREGHEVYVDLPKHFVYANRRGCFDELASTEVVIGENKGGMDTGWLAGRYVVVRTAVEGGGIGHGPHDVFPDGHRVTAERLEDDRRLYAPPRVSFYQTGSFTAMIEAIEPVGRATAVWQDAT